MALAVLLLCTYGFHVASTGLARGARGDFASAYTGATIVREGNAHRLYDLSLQASIGDRVMAPDRIVLPYDAMPLGAVALVPLTLLPLADAFAVWTTAQFLLVFLAVVISVRSAPGRRERSLVAAAAIVGIAVTQVGLGNLVDVGQWSGVNALGVAMAYRSWRRESYAAGGAWLIASAAIVKPHLALGLAAFLIGWGNRRALYGAAGAGVAALALSLATVGVGGLAAMVANDIRLAGVLNQAGGASVFALPAVWFANTAASSVAGVVGGLVCLTLCGILGRRLRANALLLGPALATATALSLLASPHAYLYDVVMLSPAVAWSLADLGLFSTPQRRGYGNAWTIVVLWAVLPWIQTLFVSALLPLVTRIGILHPWLTIALAAALWSNATQTHRSAARTLAAPERAHTTLVEGVPTPAVPAHAVVLSTSGRPAGGDATH